MTTERWFLKVDGITGESTDAAHKGEIDVQAWSWGGSNTGSPSHGSGAGQGKTSFQDFNFIARISRATPQLFLSCATGTHIKEALLSGVRNVGKGKGNDFLKYKLSDVTVASFQHFDGEDAVPTEQFSLNFSKVEMSYYPQSASGKVAAPVTAGYDVKANKKF